MVNWFNGLGTLAQVFAVVAIPATVLLVVQTIFTLFFGTLGGGTSDCDVGDDAGAAITDDGLHLFTVRGVIAFFCMFGWTGLVLEANDIHSALSVVIAAAVGVLFMILMAYIFATFMKLQANGAVEISTAIGASGTVYLPIPAARKGNGKVNVLASGRYMECTAMTDEEEALPTNTGVTVVDVSGNTLIVVRK
ncbi:MAG: NfeD family protein [Oscillospiraceae bacterium]|nr:NfeD family protein [Oscillospiraceae bacterium]